jgi:hypothetical protein
MSLSNAALESKAGLYMLQVFAIASGLVLLCSLFLLLYLKMGKTIRLLLANLRMKSLFWKDRRQRAKGRKKQ